MPVRCIKKQFKELNRGGMKQVLQEVKEKHIQIVKGQTAVNG